jgi:hypothetical protein
MWLRHVVDQCLAGSLQRWSKLLVIRSLCTIPKPHSAAPAQSLLMETKGVAANWVLRQNLEDNCLVAKGEDSWLSCEFPVCIIIFFHLIRSTPVFSCPIRAEVPALPVLAAKLHLCPRTGHLFSEAPILASWYTTGLIHTLAGTAIGATAVSPMWVY